MTKYKAINFFGSEIKVVECEKESEKSIWINGQRELKETTYYKYFDTFEDAKEYLINISKEMLERSEIQLQRQIERLELTKKLVNKLMECK